MSKRRCLYYLVGSSRPPPGWWVLEILANWRTNMLKRNAQFIRAWALSIRSWAVFSYFPMMIVGKLTQIAPNAGDYNFDGQADPNDYVEWRDAFGGRDGSHLYADGSGSGVVDGVDYVAWRNAQTASSANATTVPEPSLMSLSLTASIGNAGFKRRRT